MIPPHGPRDAKIVFVIDWAEKDDGLMNIPLVGAHGEEMERMLAKAGIRRHITKIYKPGFGWSASVDSDVYVTYFHKEWIQKEFEFINLYFEDKKGKDPKPAYYKAQKDLAFELQQLKPNVIVACGEYSLRALTSRHGIGNWRGSVVESTLLQGKKVLCMYRPATVIAVWDVRPLHILDCKKAKKESEYPEIRRMQREFVIRPSIEQVLAVEERLLNAEYVSWDIETKYNHTACIGYSDDPAYAICVPNIERGKAYWPTAAQEARVWQFHAKVLQNQRSKKVGQNLLFDSSHMYAHGIKVKNIYHDTMLAQNILYPELEKSLGVLVSIYTDEQYHKGDGRKALKQLGSDKAWAGATADEDLWLYNCKDASYTLQIAYAQMKEFAAMNSFERVII